LDDTVPYSQEIATTPTPLPKGPLSVAPQPAEQQNTDFRLVKGKADPLSNFFPCYIECEGIHAKSVEHVFHLVRAAAGEEVDLAKRIWNAPDAPQVKRIVKNSPIPSPGLNFDVCLMRHLLQAKFEQCAEFREALQASGSLPLLHSTYEADQMWATGLHHGDIDSHRRCLAEGCFPGQNLHGLLLMELRGKYFGSDCSDYGLPPNVLPDRPSLKLQPLLDVLPSDLNLTMRSVPLLKEKPRSLMDVEVDPCYIMPWYYKHGYFMSHMSQLRTPFRRSQPTVCRM
jgi:predicted NAD-dependent protein-ADP-ribosyltransferase YbiA (DUF1768 family)